MLGDYLQSLSGKKRQAGFHDCCTFPADWCLLNKFSDPMADFRGRYSTEEEGVLLLEKEGGLLNVSDKRFTSIGIDRRNGDPKIGDIAVINVIGHEAGSIFTGKRWAFVGGNGLAFSSVDTEFILAVWAMS